jgi:iron complex outermembrane receptor protein
VRRGYRANGDIFHDSYTNIQRYVNLATVPASTITENAASAKLYGLDLDLFVSMSKFFDVSLSYTYLHAKYDSFLDQVQGDLSHSRFPNTPTSQLTLTPVVHLPMPENMGKLSALASIYYQSSEAFDPANVPNGNPVVAISALAANVPGYTKTDLRLEWADIYQSRVMVAAYVRNLTNKLYIVGTDNQLPTLFGTNTSTYGAPRMWGVEARYSFGR